MDFYRVKTSRTEGKKGVTIEVYPDFGVTRSRDLMVRGKSFYAIWDEERGLWSTDIYDVPRLVDSEMKKKADEILLKEKADHLDETVSVKVRYLTEFSSGSWLKFITFVKNLGDNAHQLDERLTFLNDKVTKKDYVSKRLDYALQEGDYSAWDEMIGTLYSPEERAKIEWAIGSVVCGDCKDIQKFIVLFGDPGTGKGTVLSILEKLFAGYYAIFDANALTSNSNQFAAAAFKDNPLVAIQGDSKLDRIENNTILNSIVSHEDILVNEKYQAAYPVRPNSFLFLATNDPVKITGSKSGLIRRLIDVSPKFHKNSPIPPDRYSVLKSQISFQLGAIAKHCLDVYREMGKNYYDGYRPLEMISRTDVFFNFIEFNYPKLQSLPGVSLKSAYAMYKEYLTMAGAEKYQLPMYKFKDEFGNYFDDFKKIARINGEQVRSWYTGFQSWKVLEHDTPPEQTPPPPSLTLDETVSLLDDLLKDCPAQYANSAGTPKAKWENVKTTLKDLDTTKVHYILFPEEYWHLLCVDFDLKDEEGNKDAVRNLTEASKWPPTYAEFSKSGAGLHLYYWYTGDIDKLAKEQSPGIEIKIFTGKSSLRRKLSRCNNVPIATISGGLKQKEVKVVSQETIRSEKALRNLIERNLRKEVHPGTKPSIDFIRKILDDAYSSGLHYDVTNMRQAVTLFAMGSTNHKDYCLKQVQQMKWQSADISASAEYKEEDQLVFFDCEVFPNLLLVNWKYHGDDRTCTRMINPGPSEIEGLMKYKLVGFNCRRYDNHILYAAMLGYTNQQIYALSQAIIGGDRNAMFREAYNVSYTDVYDFSSTKQSLKKWEIELGIHHQELGLPWDQPVPEEKWQLVAEYCDNDVIATEKLFYHLKEDWSARKILASVAGLTVNDTTNTLTTRIIFGSDRKPQAQFNYRELSGRGLEPESFTALDGCDHDHCVMDQAGRPVFPGYLFENGKSTYRGEDVGEGGYAYSEPGAYYNVALLDIASMHPSSIVAENLFGDIYTARFKDILDARLAAKHFDRDAAAKLLDGALLPYMETFEASQELAAALKIAINSVYGLTSAKFDNPFRDIRNRDNIVAKRGALFMINLKHEVQARGFTVAHIKTDSIKIPNATKDIIDFVTWFGKQYGYTFEHEATYDRMCIVNKAAYIARYDDHGIRTKGGKKAGQWTATADQFKQPYVFKKLFSHEEIGIRDMTETKSVTTALYLDFNEEDPEQHNYRFVGKAGAFCPVRDGCGGGLLMREKDGKYYAAEGTTGYRWKEAETVSELGQIQQINRDYYEVQCEKAVQDISVYEDFDTFVSGPTPPIPEVQPGDSHACTCGDGKYGSCFDCPNFHPMDSADERDILGGTCDAGYKTKEETK